MYLLILPILFISSLLITQEFIDYEPNDTTATATGPIFTGTTYYGYIYPAGDNDYYYFFHRSTITMIHIYMRPPLLYYDYELYLLNAYGLTVSTSNRGKSPAQQPYPEEIFYLPTKEEAEAGKFFVHIKACASLVEFSDTERYIFFVNYAGGAISGKVSSIATGLPIANATVEAYENDKLVKSAKTNINGEYVLVLKESTYTIKASAEGYISVSSANVVVELGIEKRLDFALENYTPERVVEITMPDAFIVQLLMTNSLPDLLKIKSEKNALDISGFIVWESSISRFYLPFSTYTSFQDLPPNLQLKFAIANNGDFYVGVTTSPTGNICDPLCVLTFGGVGYYNQLSQGINERQNFLYYIAKEIFKELKYKGYIRGGPDNENEFLNLSVVGLYNRYTKPISIVLGALAKTSEQGTRFSNLIPPLFGGDTRSFQITYTSTMNSFITLTCFSDEGNISSATVDGVTAFQHGYGGSVKMLVNSFPINVNLYSHLSERKVFSKFCGVFVADSVSVDTNIGVIVKKFEKGWNYSGGYGRISGKTMLGDSTVLKDVKIEMLSDENVCSRTYSMYDGNYVFVSTVGTFKIKFSSYPEIATKLTPVSVYPNQTSSLDITLNELIKVPITEKIIFQDDGSIVNYSTFGIVIQETGRIKLTNNNYYHSIAVTTMTFDRTIGDIRSEIVYKSDGSGIGGFGFGHYEGKGENFFAIINYGVLFEGTTRKYIISNEIIHSEQFSPEFSTYTIYLNKNGGGKIIHISTYSYGEETTINNIPFIIFGSTDSFYLDSLKITQYEELQISTGVISGRVYKSDGITPLGGSMVTIIHNITHQSTSTTSQDYTGIYSLTFDSGPCKITASKGGYTSQTKDIIVLAREKQIVNFTLNETPAKPDLIISSLVPSATAPYIGENIHITITIKNIGEASVNTTFYVDFYKNLPSPPTLSQPGDYFWIVNSLPAGGEKTLTYSFIYQGEELNSYAQIDTANGVDEKDEMNNTFGPVKIATLLTMAKLEGVIKSKRDTKPISMATVDVYKENMKITSTKTNLLGHYRFTLPVNTTYQIEINADYFVSVSSIVYLEKDLELNFQLEYTPPYGTLYGYVKNAYGLPVPYASIELIGPTTRQIYVQPDGFYRMFLLEGYYDVNVKARGYPIVEEQSIRISSLTPTERKFTLQIPHNMPYPVNNFIAIPIDGLKIQLKWTKSASTDVVKYLIYYQPGELDFTNLYLTPKGYVEALPNIDYYTYTTPPLERAKLYTFSVRPFSTVENVETNSLIQVYPVDKQIGIKMRIKQPQTPSKIYPEILTIYAEPMWKTSKINEVEFQYKLIYSSEWEKIKSFEGSKNTNPDKSEPFFIHANLTNLVPEHYQIRAVAKYNSFFDYTPIAFTLAISTITYNIRESENRKQQIVFNNVNNQVIMASFNEDKITTLEIPQNSLNTSSAVLTFEVISAPQNQIEYFVPYKFRRISLDTKQKFLNKDFSIFFPYDDEDNDGLIDGTSSKVDYIWVYEFDKDYYPRGYIRHKDYEMIKKHEEISIQNTVKIKSKKISTYGTYYPQEYHDFNVVVFPNPFRAYQGHKTIKFKGLTKNVNIKIFNIAAELVFEDNTPGAFYEWDVKNKYGQPIASGVYVYLLKDAKGKTAKGKFIILR